MRCRIVFIGIEGFFNLAKDVIKTIELPEWINIEYIEHPLAGFGNLEDIKELYEFETATVLICGDRTAMSLANLVSNIVIPVGASSFDFLKVIQRVRSNEIYIVHFHEMFTELNNIKDILNVKIKQLKFNTVDEGRKILTLLQSENVQEIVGGTWICEEAKKYNITGFCYLTDRSMSEALKQAISILESHRKEIQKNVFLTTIFNLNKGGIIATDDKQRITAINPSAERLCGVKSSQTLGKSLAEIIPNMAKHYKQSDSRPYYNIIFEHNKRNIVADIVPVGIDEDKFGYILAVNDIAELQENELKIRKKIINKTLSAIYSFDDIISGSQSIGQLKNKARLFSESTLSILIQGESGTGKELFAQSIHNASPRSTSAFVAVNCAALPESLLNSELFGYEEGAFTGAKKGGKPGLFELAHQGTVFLDEISEMPLHLQSNLLRVLQEKEVMRIGGHQVIPVDIRVITASNKDLLQCIQNKTFREDLYYRISVLQLHIPPLRKRLDDIPELIKCFVANRELREILLSPDILNLLRAHYWQGNIREFNNVIERFQILSKQERYSKKIIFKLIHQALNPSAEWYDDIPESPHTNLQKVEIDLIKKTLENVNGDKNYAAKLLGISRTTLWRKLKEND